MTPMATIRVHFDGKVFVPDEPVDLPVGTPAETLVRAPAEPDASSAAGGVRSSLARLARIAEEHPDDPATPTDLAAQKHHYLYG